MGVYTPLQANAKLSLEKLYDGIKDQLALYPDRVITSRGPQGQIFQENLKQLTPMANRPYFPNSDPSLGTTDLENKTKAIRTVQIWSEKATSMLQDCIDCCRGIRLWEKFWISPRIHKLLHRVCSITKEQFYCPLPEAVDKQQ